MNKVILVGRLTKDPELRYTAGSNVPVVQTTVAVDRKYKSEGQPTADFIPIVAWRSTAEFINKYFTKGSRIGLTGSIQTRSYDDNEGKKRYVTEVIVDEVEFVESKKQEGGYQSGLVPPPETGAQAGKAVQVTQASGAAFGDDGYFSIDNDDDVPF